MIFDTTTIDNVDDVINIWRFYGVKKLFSTDEYQNIKYLSN